MREIIHLQGGCIGNAVGNRFLASLAAEHSIFETTRADDLREKINVYYNESSAGQYTPRAVLFECDKDDAAKSMRSHHFAAAGLTPAHMVCHGDGTHMNFALGFYFQEKIWEPLRDAVRRQAEACDSLQGFHLCHSLAGGTGGGLGPWLLDALREEYPDRTLATFSTVPWRYLERRKHDHVIEPYTFVLAMHYVITRADFSVLLDFQATQQRCARPNTDLEIATNRAATRDAQDEVVAAAMSAVTAPWRFPGMLNHDMRLSRRNLVTVPGLNFLIPSIASTTDCPRFPFTSDVTERDLRQISGWLTDANLVESTYLAAHVVLRGTPSPLDIGPLSAHHHSASHALLHPTESSHVPTSRCRVATPGAAAGSVSALVNTTAVADTLEHFLTNFEFMFRRKAFLSSYCGNGMDEMEFAEAQETVTEIRDRYRERRKALLARWRTNSCVAQ